LHAIDYGLVDNVVATNRAAAVATLSARIARHGAGPPEGEHWVGSAYGEWHLQLGPIVCNSLRQLAHRCCISNLIRAEAQVRLA
jgi:hypothetical protein